MIRFIARTVRTLAFCAPAFLAASAANAALPPLSEAELMAQADLVVDAEGIDVTCVSAARRIGGATGYIETPYRSTLRTLATHKGTELETFEIVGSRIEWTPESQPLSCAHFQAPIAEGFVAKMYLKRQSDGSYATFHSSVTTVVDAARSAPAALPDCGRDASAGPAPVVDETPTDETSTDEVDEQTGARIETKIDDDAGGCVCVEPRSADDHFGLALFGVLCLGFVVRRVQRA